MKRPTGFIARAIVLVGMVGAGILPASCDKKPLAERGPDGGGGVGGGGGSGGGGAGGQVVGGSGGQAVGGSDAGGAGGHAEGGAGGSGATFVCPKLTSSPLRCQHGLQFCKLTSIGTSSCEPLPAACGSTPSCSCIPLTFPSCDFCMASGAGDIEVIFAADCLNPDGSR